MRVVQLLPELKVGGVERGTVDLSDHLIKRGHDSAVISAGGQLVDLLNDHGAKHYNLPIAKKNIRALSQIRNLKKIYLEFQPDIVHVRSRFPAWINYFALKNFSDKKPIVVSTFHGLYSKPFYSKSMTYADYRTLLSDLLAEGKSTPTSITVVDTIRLILPSINFFIADSFSADFSFP